MALKSWLGGDFVMALSADHPAEYFAADMKLL
jgi:hypothetical protein